MNITLFGGSFNPPHLGHKIIISQAFELIENLDELWLLPDYQHAFAKGKFFAPAKTRLKLVKKLMKATDSPTTPVRVETCCFDQKMPGNTIFHITYLRKKYPHHQFSFLMGSDNLTTFDRWPKYKILLKLMKFYIYPRSGHPLKPLYKNMTPLEHPLQVITNISSTMVRNRLEQKLPTKLLTV
jgi:nicotinate-nucleotide adenylyltransferase